MIKYIRSICIGNSIKNILHEKGISITAVCQKIGASRPTVNNILNGKTIGSDEYFSKILHGISLSDQKIQAIFEDADREYFKHKYGKELDLESDYSSDDLFLALQKKEGLSDEEISIIRKISDAFIAGHR